jgi:glycosyltransferase involved in cell wall biosynthesis
MTLDTVETEDRVPLISIITPTQDRERFLPLAYHCVKSQSWPSLEWLVYDSSVTPSLFMESLRDKRVTYIHDATPLTLGDKRNALVAKARGEFITHFDDDDYYAPEYVAYMLTNAIRSGKGFVKLSAYLLLNIVNRTYAYWNLDEKEGVHFAWARGSLRLHSLTKDDGLLLADNHLGFGFSYFYKRSLWENDKFSSMNWNEDRDFAQRIDSKFPVLAFHDTTGLCLHVLHEHNTSICFPQFVIPEFLVLKHLPFAEAYLTLLNEIYRIEE